MSRWDLPKSWEWARTGAIADIIGGGTPSTKNPGNFTERGIPWLTPADLSGYQEVYIGRGKRDLSQQGYESSGAQLIPRDSVLFTSRAPVGYCVLAANEICTNQGFKSLVLRGNISAKFVRHYLRASRDYAESLASGSTFKELSGARMAELEVPIPPINEQKRIVARIEELQKHSRKAQDAMEVIPDLLDRLRQSVLAAAFRGDLTKEWRKKNPNAEPASELLKRIRTERRKRWEEVELEKLKAKGLTGEKLNAEFAKRRKQYKEPAPVDTTTNLPELPEGWIWASVDELSDSLQYGSSSKSSKSGKVPVLRMGNLQNGEIDWSDLVFTSNDAEIRKYSLSPDTVLFNRTNSPELVGKTAIYRGQREAIFAGYLIRILHAPQILASYLNLMLNSPFIKELCLSVKSDAVSQSNINANKLSSFPTPLCSQQEQAALVSVAEPALAEARKKRNEVIHILSTLTDLDQDILSKAFRGELVPQDPNDEPASELLERIWVAKARMAEEEKGKPKERGRKMKGKMGEQQDVLTVLRHADRPMAPEEVFTLGGFEEESVDEFYEQLRNAVAAKQVREIRKGNWVGLEATKT